MQREMTIPDRALAQAEARLPRWMVLCGGTATIAALLWGQARFAGGLALGSALGILNYFWLHQAVDALMNAGQSRVSRLMVAKILARYPLALGAVMVFYWTGWLPFLGILAGLFVPAAGVLIEAIVQLREGFRTEC